MQYANIKENNNYKCEIDTSEFRTPLCSNIVRDRRKSFDKNHYSFYLVRDKHAHGWSLDAIMSIA